MTIDLNKHGWCVSTFSRCTKVRTKYPEYAATGDVIWSSPRSSVQVVKPWYRVPAQMSTRLSPGQGSGVPLFIAHIPNWSEKSTPEHTSVWCIFGKNCIDEYLVWPMSCLMTGHGHVGGVIELHSSQPPGGNRDVVASPLESSCCSHLYFTISGCDWIFQHPVL